VKLQPDVVIVHGGASVLKQVSEDHGTWTLDKSASGVSNLAPGKVLLIAGLDCARVTSITDNGSTIDVTVTPVAFIDVIQEGSFQFQNQAINPAQGIVTQVPAAVINAGDVTDGGAPDGGDGGTSDASCDSGAGGSDGGSDAGGVGCLDFGGLRVQPQSTNVSLSINGWTVSFVASPSGSGVDIDAKSSSMIGSINASAEIKVHVQSVSGVSGSLNVSGGSITSSSLTAPVDGSVDLSVQVSTPVGAQFPKQALIKLPIAVNYPFPCIAGIPCYLSFSTNFLMQPSLATKNAVLGVSTHVDFSGTDGMTFNGGNASATSKPSVTPPLDVLNTVTAPPSLGTTAIVFAAQGPRIGLGIGTMAFGSGVKAGIFADVVNSLAVTIASAMDPIPCQSASWTYASHAGGEMSISLLGVSGGVTNQITVGSATQSWFSPMLQACKIGM